MPGPVLSVLRLRNLPFAAVALSGHLHGGIKGSEQGQMPAQPLGCVLARVMHHHHRASGQAL